MTDKLFDDFIKNKLKDHSSPVPTGMWEKVRPQDDAKRRGAFWWKSVGLILLIAIGVAVGLSVRNNTTDDIPGIVATDFPAKHTSDRAGEINSNKEDTSGSNANDINSDSNSTSALGASPSKVSDAANIAHSQDDVTRDLNDVSIHHKKSTSSFNRSNVFHKSASSKKGEIKSLIFNRTLIDQSGSSVNDFTLSSFNKTYQTFVSSTVRGEDILKAQTNFDLSNRLKKYDISCFVDCPTARTARRNDWYIEVFASPDYARKNVIKNAGVSDDYLRRKDSTETIQSAFTAGFRLSKTIADKILIKSGLQYSQINEKFSYRTENERRTVTVITVRKIIRSPGDTLTVSDTSAVEQIGYRVRTTSNRYRSIDVPVILSYEFGNEKLKIGLSAGVILNVRSWQTGEMLDTSFATVSFNKTGTGQPFKQNIGMGLYAGVSLLKSVGNNMEIFAEPYYRYNVSNMTKDQNPFTQKFNVAGINLGVRYKLVSGIRR